jgi:hypothetical protein
VYKRVFGYKGSMGVNDKALSGSAFGGMLAMMVSEVPA